MANNNKPPSPNSQRVTKARPSRKEVKKQIRTTTMGLKTKTPGGLSAREVLIRKRAASAFSTQDGRAIDKGSAQARAIILKGNTILRAQEYTQETDTSLYTTKKLAEDFLRDVNCTLVPLPPTFSLLGKAEIEKKPSNPNIVNKLSAADTNSKVAASKNFPDDCDPIYELDEAETRTEQYQKKRTSQASRPNLTYTAMTVVQLNLLSNKRLNLKEFLSEEAFKRSSY